MVSGIKDLSLKQNDDLQLTSIATRTLLDTGAPSMNVIPFKTLKELNEFSVMLHKKEHSDLILAFNARLEEYGVQSSHTKYLTYRLNKLLSDELQKSIKWVDFSATKVYNILKGN